MNTFVASTDIEVYPDPDGFVMINPNGPLTFTDNSFVYSVLFNTAVRRQLSAAGYGGPERGGE